jgi:hypothetical protein
MAAAGPAEKGDDLMKKALMVVMMAAAASVSAEPFAVVQHGKAAVTLYREACELKDVSNLKNRATWEEDGKRFEGCFGVFFDAAIGFYFDDKQVAVIPVAAFVPVRGM